MANAENAIMKIKIEGAIKEAIYKTYGKACYLEDGSTVEAKIASILADVAALPTDSAVDAKVEAMRKQILGLTDADTTINEAYDTLKEVATWIDEHGEVATAFTTDIADLKTAVQALQAIGATKVEASETNGKIKVDGKDITVYTPPETISADKVTTTASKQFVTAAEKADWNARPVVYTSSTEPADMKDGDIWLQIIE